MPTPITPAQAKKLLAPFINARFKAAGYPRTAAVDLHAPGIGFRDADIRAVTDEGILSVRSAMNGSDLLRWDERLQFTICAMDGRGEYTAMRSFTVVAEQAELAA